MLLLQKIKLMKNTSSDSLTFVFYERYVIE